MITHNPGNNPMEHQPHTYDDLKPGQSFLAGPRTISAADVAAFARLSGDQTALHTDESYAATTPFGGIVAHGALVLAAATGLAYDMGVFEGTVLAFRSMEVSYDRPVKPGDQLSLTLTVEALDERPRPDRGRVSFRAQVANGDGKVVLSGCWRLVLRRSA